MVGKDYRVTCNPHDQKSSCKVRNRNDDSYMQTLTLSVKARLMNTLKMLKSFLKDNKDVDFISDEFIAIILL